LGIYRKQSDEMEFQQYMKKDKIIIISAVAFACVCMGIVAVLIFNGVILLNNPPRNRYSIRGVDVSSYQGEIDWHTLSNQDISFAFIKATEGSSFVDSRFDYNFSEAQKQDIAVGAYHFFSYDSQGETQADNFIKNVTAFEGMLPPVIDLEFYGDKEKNPPSKEAVIPQLKAMIKRLKSHYGLNPIIYATEKSYQLYLADGFEDNPIWIRNVLTKPTLSDGREWTFWQYTNRERLKGYNGKEKYIDMNVFNGTKEQFKQLTTYK